MSKLNPPQLSKAFSWLNYHFNHVVELVKTVSDEGYPPSKKDVGDPSLWKPPHWKWFAINHSPTLLRLSR